MKTFYINKMAKSNSGKLIIGLFLLISGIAPALAQQNVQFTQYIFNSLSVNPAYAGYKEEWFAQMALRKQWSGIKDAPQTGQVSIDGILDPEKKRMGLGLQLAADKLGPQLSNSAYLNYSYRLQLNSEDTKRLSFGLGAGLTQNTVDASKLSAINGSDQYLPKGGTTDIVPDVRFGAYYYSPKFYMGLSLMDALSSASKVSATSDPNTIQPVKHMRHLYLLSGLLFDLDNQIKLRPSILYKEDFKGPSSVDLNAMLIFNDRFWVGAGYRTGAKLWKKDYQEGQGVRSVNSISGIVQFYINDNLRLGYSYDYSTSSLREIESGSHEITLGLTIPRKAYRVLSPRFF